MSIRKSIIIEIIFIKKAFSFLKKKFFFNNYILHISYIINIKKKKKKKKNKIKLIFIKKFL